MALKPNVVRMRDLFLKAGLLDQMQMKAVLGQLEQWGGRLPKIMVEMGLVDEEVVSDTLSKALQIPVAHLGMLQKDSAAMARLDADFCESHGVFPMQLRERVLMLAMADPTELAVVDEVSAKVGARLQVYLASERQIIAAINKHYRGQQPSTDRAPNMARRAVTSEYTPPSEQEYTLSGTGEDQSAQKFGLNSSANSILDDMLDVKKPSTGMTSDELTRLEGAKTTQQKTQAILKALHELLRDKKILE
jgi:type II secretory ATPase GspE/PulE/Tfp pilus assembly ATPase PilB-like protein